MQQQVNDIAGIQRLAPPLHNSVQQLRMPVVDLDLSQNLERIKRLQGERR